MKEVSLKTLDAKIRTKIHSLMSSAGESIRMTQRATQKAKRELAHRNTKAEKERKEQEVRERKLDGILVDVVQGLTNIIELGCTKEINKLATARASIGKQTSLFNVGDEHTTASVCFTKDSVILFICTNVVSPVQSVDAFTSYTDCELTRTYPLTPKEAIGPGWFWHVFHNDFSTLWFEDHLEKDIPAGRGEDQHMQVRKDELRRFERLNLEAAITNPTWWENVEVVGWVLLRFLADCKDPKNLSYHLDRALKNLR